MHPVHLKVKAKTMNILLVTIEFKILKKNTLIKAKIKEEDRRLEKQEQLKEIIYLARARTQLKDQ